MSEIKKYLDIHTWLSKSLNDLDEFAIKCHKKWIPLDRHIAHLQQEIEFLNKIKKSIRLTDLENDLVDDVMYLIETRFDALKQQIEEMEK